MMIIVHGIPAPQGSKRHVGGGRMIEMSKAVGPWREAIRAETQRALNGDGPLRGAVSVIAEFRLPRPKNHYRTGSNAALLRSGAPWHPAGKPDLDKLARALLDGLTAGGAWADDAQVAHMAVGKAYATDSAVPGCTVEIRGMA
jgi:crossover junction endodeoxyribonuclease RusA